jgi:hypothetical protein
MSIAYVHDETRALKTSAPDFGWRSASSAAVNALESAKASAAEVTEMHALIQNVSTPQLPT